MILFGQNFNFGASHVRDQLQSQPKIPTPQEGAAIQKTANTDLSNVSAGRIFDGTVLDISRNQVSIQLSNGQLLHARMEESVPLLIGQQMQFQVKSNNGQVVSIRPYMDGEVNPTLVRALEAANLPVSDKTLSMVHSMMDSQMSIDKQSLASMVRTMYQFPQAEPEALVQMKALQIPMTPENVEQFLQYREQPVSVLSQMEHLLEEIPNALSQLASQEGSEIVMEEGIIGEGTPSPLEDITLETAKEGTVSFKAEEGNGLQREQAEAGKAGTAADGTMNTTLKEMNQKLFDIILKNEGNGTPMKELLSESDQMALSNELRQTLLPDQLKEELSNGSLTPKEFFSKLEDILHSQSDEGAGRLLSELAKSPSYGKLLAKSVEEQWLFDPKKEDLGEKMENYYKKLDGQMKELLQTIQSSGTSGEKLMDSGQSLKNNLEFMNQINQAYTYLQIPLKLSGQNAHSDLYVYTNKKIWRTGRESFPRFCIWI